MKECKLLPFSILGSLYTSWKTNIKGGIILFIFYICNLASITWPLSRKNKFLVVDEDCNFLFFSLVCKSFFLVILSLSICIFLWKGLYFVFHKKGCHVGAIPSLVIILHLQRMLIGDLLFSFFVFLLFCLLKQS